MLPVALLAAPPAAADKVWPVSSFERLRVEGPVAVSVAVGSPSARTATTDRAILARLTVTREGDTLLVRLKGAAPTGLGVASDDAPLARVSLSTPRLSALRVQGTAPVSVARLSGTRVDVAATGGGTVTVAAIDASVLGVTMVGGGALALAGRAATARLTLNGDGAIDAGALAADAAAISLVGKGAVRAAARHSAQVVASGGGRVTVTGNARCTVRATGGTVVDCGR